MDIILKNNVKLMKILIYFLNSFLTSSIADCLASSNFFSMIAIISASLTFANEAVSLFLSVPLGLLIFLKLLPLSMDEGLVVFPGLTVFTLEALVGSCLFIELIVFDFDSGAFNGVNFGAELTGGGVF